MSRPLTAWLLGGVLALCVPAWAQTPPAGEGSTTTTTTKTTTTTDSDGHHMTVTKEEVKTWTRDIDGKEWEMHPFTPTYEGTTGLFHMPSAYTLPKKGFAFSLFRDNLDRDPKDEDISIHGLSLGYGISNKFEIYGNIGLQNRIDADALFQPGFVNDYPFVATPWETGVGDVKLGVKFAPLNDYRGDAVGLAVRAFVKLPTADDQKGLGTGKTSFGADLILSKRLGDFADIHGSVGFQQNSDPDDVDIGNAFKWGLGLDLPTCKRFQIQAELMGTNYSGDDLFPQTNPLDLVIGPVVYFGKGFFIRPAISWNLNFDDRGLDQSSKSWTGRHISIGYHPGIPCHEIAVPPPPPPPPTNRPPTVQCEIEKSVCVPGETVRVRATASDPDGDPLTYEWTNATGTGATATMVCPQTGTGTCTVRVSDGRGGTAESSCSTAPQEVRKAEAVTCTSGGFPRNLARLNNVDKACLDDVASRLKADPRSRVIVVGYADSQERFPEVIARQRAEAVKAYLVKDRGIEEARITVRSAAATKPLDTGTSAMSRAKNRRVDVIFVPEGATVPEED